MPLTLEVRVLVFEVKVLDKGIEEVGIVSRVFVRSREPIITVLPLRVVLADIRDVVFVVEAVIFVAKRLVKNPLTELMIFAKILSPVVVPVNFKLERESIVVVAMSPAISEVSRFVEEENDKELLLTVVVPVEEEDTPEIVVVAITPFTFEVKIPFVKSMAFVVATVIEALVNNTPLIVVVPLRIALFTLMLPKL
jgi:rRNA processing protein Gar1